jgi:hypothetical protein
MSSTFAQPSVSLWLLMAAWLPACESRGPVGLFDLTGHPLPVWSRRCSTGLVVTVAQSPFTSGHSPVAVRPYTAGHPGPRADGHVDALGDSVVADCSPGHSYPRFRPIDLFLSARLRTLSGGSQIRCPRPKGSFRQPSASHQRPSSVFRSFSIIIYDRFLRGYWRRQTRRRPRRRSINLPWFAGPSGQHRYCTLKFNDQF